MKIKRVIVLISVMAVLAGSAFAWGGGSCGKGGHQEKAKGKMASELNLTADQQKRLDAEKASHRKEMSALVDALKAKKHELQEALAKPGVTRKAVEPAVAAIKELESKMTDSRVNGILGVKEILTPEQFEKLQSMKKGREEGKFRNHGGKEHTR